MSEEDEREVKTHIVEADTDYEAMEKVQTYYKTKDSSYGISHYVDINYCNEMIR